MLPNRQIKTAAATRPRASPRSRQTAASAQPIGPDTAPFSYSQPSPDRRSHAPQSGFDWGDAGIGAAGGLAISMLGLGGALVITSQRRTRRPTRSASPTS